MGEVGYNMYTKRKRWVRHKRCQKYLMRHYLENGSGGLQHKKQGCVEIY